MICQLSRKNWIINPREDAEKQLKTIRHLVERADTIVLMLATRIVRGSYWLMKFLMTWDALNRSCVTGVMRTMR